ncbi:TIGR04290 family methyltransferase [Gilvimarinus sp. F26214L]|uniref:TIGR04290 family methyltransferase n=1 Tax=Gilvimarinus sp. DZF01 TaxID=3461371 RepID=UPI004046221B
MATSKNQGSTSAYSADNYVSPTWREAAALAPWFHNLHLPDGTQTAPDHELGDFPNYKWQELEPSLPSRLDGWSVLDIGCNAGFYSLELARRGADVTGIDSNPHYLKQARWAAEKFGLKNKIEFRQQQVYDLGHSNERYDLVLFLGVLYHLRYPLLALDIVCSRTKHLLCLQTMTMPGEEVFEHTDGLGLNDRDYMLDPGWPKMSFIEGRLANDPTNWWAPNHACVEAMLRTCGMDVLSRPGTEFYLCKPCPIEKETREFTTTELNAVIGQHSDHL